MREPKRVAVLGGGPAGVVLSEHLARRGMEVHLFERAPALGGLHRTVDAGGLRFDIGSFIFSTDHEIVSAFPGLRNVLHAIEPCRPLVVNTRGRVDAYPITIRGFLRDHGARGMARALLDLAEGRVRHSGRENVPAYAKFYMGRYIYEESGLQAYIERLYGVRDEELGVQFALQRLQPVTSFTVAGTAKRLVRDAVMRVRRGEPLVPLVRPAEGFAPMYRFIREELERKGVTIRCSTDLKRLRRVGDVLELDFDQSTVPFDRVVSTIPIQGALSLLGIPCQGRYEHVSLLSLFYMGKLRNQVPEIYNFTRSGPWKRIVAFSKYYGQVDGQDYFTVEVTTSNTEKGHLDQLRADFERHARAYDVVAETPTLAGLHVTPRAYPLFRPDAEAGIAADRRTLREHGIEFVGRQGAYEYLSSHQAAARARQLAARV